VGSTSNNSLVRFYLRFSPISLYFVNLRLSLVSN
jgi:hypothetical protein